MRVSQAVWLVGGALLLCCAASAQEDQPQDAPATLPAGFADTETLMERLPLYKYVTQSVLLRQWSIAGLHGLEKEQQRQLLEGVWSNLNLFWQYMAGAHRCCNQAYREGSADANPNAACNSLVRLQRDCLALAAAHVGHGNLTCSADGPEDTVVTLSLIRSGLGMDALQRSLEHLYGPGSWGSTFLMRILGDVELPALASRRGPYNAFSTARYHYDHMLDYLHHDGFAARIMRPWWFVDGVRLPHTQLAADSAPNNSPNMTFLLERVLQHSIACSVLETYHQHITSAPALRQCSNISDWFDAQMSLTQLGRACQEASMSLLEVPHDGDTLPVALVGPFYPRHILERVPWHNRTAAIDAIGEASIPIFLALLTRVLLCIAGVFVVLSTRCRRLLWSCVEPVFAIAAARVLRFVGWVPGRNTRRLRQQSAARLARQAVAAGPDRSGTTTTTTTSSTSKDCMSASAAGSSSSSALTDSAARRRSPAGSSASSSSPTAAGSRPARSSQRVSGNAASSSAQHPGGLSGSSPAQHLQATGRPSVAAPPVSQPTQCSSARIVVTNVLHSLKLSYVRSLATSCMHLLLEALHAWLILPARRGAAAVWGFCKSVGAAAVQAARAMVV